MPRKEKDLPVVARNLARLRKESGLTRYELVELTKCYSLYNIEQGDRPQPRFETLDKIAKVLGCTVADFYHQPHVRRTRRYYTRKRPKR